MNRYFLAGAVFGLLSSALGLATVILFIAAVFFSYGWVPVIWAAVATAVTFVLTVFAQLNFIASTKSLFR